MTGEVNGAPPLPVPAAHEVALAGIVRTGVLDDVVGGVVAVHGGHADSVQLGGGGRGAASCK